MGAITFSSANGRYESQAISATTSNIAVHIEFEDPRNNEVVCYRSVDGNNYAVAAVTPFSEKVFDKTYSGAVAGLSLKFVTKNEPSNAQYI